MTLSDLSVLWNSTTTIAIYGALVATATFAWEIVKYLKDKPVLRVDFGVGIVNLPEISKKVPVLSLGIYNIGKHRVILTSAGMLFGNKTSLTIFGDKDGFPKELQPGDSHQVIKTIDEIKDIIKQQGVPISIWARDKTGRRYNGSTKYLLTNLNAVEALKNKSV